MIKYIILSFYLALVQCTVALRSTGQDSNVTHSDPTDGIRDLYECMVMHPPTVKLVALHILYHLNQLDTDESNKASVIDYVDPFHRLNGTIGHSLSAEQIDQQFRLLVRATLTLNRPPVASKDGAANLQLFTLLVVLAFIAFCFLPFWISLVMDLMAYRTLPDGATVAKYVPGLMDDLSDHHSFHFA